jgi:hypothetical protein
MNFSQLNRIREQGFEDTYFKYVIADNYSELLAPTSENEVDVLQFESFKDALNTNESSFAVNELSFTINELSCIDDVAKNCLSFCLEARSKGEFRYIALFEKYSTSTGIVNIDNLIYLGRIEPKVTGDDLVWNSVDYTKLINAKREYKFTSTEFAVSILDECKIKSTILDDAGTVVSNIYDRISRAEINALCDNETNYTKQINLYELINLALDKCQTLINVLTGEVINLNLATSNLGVVGIPLLFDIHLSSDLIVTDYSFDDTNKKTLYLCPNSYEDSTKSSVWVSRSMYDPSLCHDVGMEYKVTSVSDINKMEQSQISSEIPFSVRQFDNITDFLFEIARCFNCYLQKTYTIVSSVLNITFELIPFSAITDNTVLYVIGASDSSLDMSNEVSEKETEYYSTFNNMSAIPYIGGKPKFDGGVFLGFDKIVHDTIFFNDRTDLYNSKPTKNYKEIETEHLKAKDKKDFKRLFLSTGGLISQIRESFTQGLEFYPFNYVAVPYTYIPERLSSIIHIRTSSGPTHLRPVAYFGWKLNGKNNIGLLQNYVSDGITSNREFFLNEYSLTIPFYSAFATTMGVSSTASSSNLKKGRIIRLNENFRVYNTGTFVWENANSDYDYIITEIEKSLTSPNVKLKLQNKSRFAYGDYDATAITGSFTNDTVGTLFSFVGIEDYKYYEVDTGETILNGDAVVIFNGKIRRAKSLVAHYNRHFGFAFADGSGGDLIPINFNIIVVNAEWSFTPNEAVFVRVQAGINLSHTLIESPDGDEDMLYCVGVALNSTTLKVDLLQGELL